jgi:hypothetical protein
MWGGSAASIPPAGETSAANWRWMRTANPFLKPGARIVSHFFEIPGVKPDKSEVFESNDDSDRHTLHLWTAPLKAPAEEKK